MSTLSAAWIEMLLQLQAGIKAVWLYSWQKKSVSPVKTCTLIIEADFWMKKYVQYVSKYSIIPILQAGNCVKQK